MNGKAAKLLMDGHVVVELCVTSAAHGASTPAGATAPLTKDSGNLTSVLIFVV